MFNAKLKYICSTSSYYIPKRLNSLDPDQARLSQIGQNVRLDLGPTRLKGASADDSVM